MIGVPSIGPLVMFGVGLFNFSRLADVIVEMNQIQVDRYFDERQAYTSQVFELPGRTPTAVAFAILPARAMIPSINPGTRMATAIAEGDLSVPISVSGRGGG